MEGAERGEWKKGAGKGRREWEWKGTASEKMEYRVGN